MYVKIRDLLLDHCITKKQSEKIKAMTKVELCETFLHNYEVGFFDGEFCLDEMLDYCDKVLSEAA